MSSLALLLTLLALGETEEQSPDARLEAAFSLADFEGSGGLRVEALVSRAAGSGPDRSL